MGRYPPKKKCSRCGRRFKVGETIEKVGKHGHYCSKCMKTMYFDYDKIESKRLGITVEELGEIEDKELESFFTEIKDDRTEFRKHRLQQSTKCRSCGKTIRRNTVFYTTKEKGSIINICEECISKLPKEEYRIIVD